MKRFLSFVLLPLALGAAAQELPQTPGMQKALVASTRSADGRPGKAYWQNRARYNINIKVAPPSRTITGTEDITYINNSPSALNELVLKLIMNVHRRSQGASPARSKNATDGVVIDALTVNGKSVKWSDTAATTVGRLKLPQALASRDSVKLSFAWHFDLSAGEGREGVIDSTTFYLAYFYPRVAVYDDYMGWDETPHTGPLEFYSDFNDYTLNVQVPKNYIVWATGTLTNPTAVLRPAIASRYKQSLTDDNIIAIADPRDVAAKAVTTQNEVNTWQFVSKNVPDVALGISNHYVWDGGSVEVDKATGRRASVQAAYNDSASDFHYMVRFGKESLQWLSNSWPGVPYPYEKSTVFQGYADMEYPMMVNDNSFPDTTFSKFVVMHEMAHTYMPFYMGINETVYGFMDEGWATALEYLFNSDKMGREKADNFFKQFRVAGWARALSRGLADEAIITPGPQQKMGTSGNNQYGKPALGYLAMKELLGDALFKKALLEYMNRWNGKHPSPWDFFNSFSSAAGRNLNWFWNAWYFNKSFIDFAVKEVKASGNGTAVTVQNVGGMPAPFDAVVTYSDGTTERFHQTPAIWEKDQTNATITLATKKPVAGLTLDGGIFMDATPKDNEWKKVL